MVGMLIVKINVESIIYVQINVKQKWVNVQLVQNGILKDFDVMIQEILLHLVNDFFEKKIFFSFHFVHLGGLRSNNGLSLSHQHFSTTIMISSLLTFQQIVLCYI
jgi:hypothetical protein